ncbi:MAG: hypothetical protein HY540_06675 [Deltaproteobacteria bacterium]|nr:hypothetical protein [Deltaproteobacteria bacterium]
MSVKAPKPASNYSDYSSLLSGDKGGFFHFADAAQAPTQAQAMPAKSAPHKDHYSLVSDNDEFWSLLNGNKSKFGTV